MISSLSEAYEEASLLPISNLNFPRSISNSKQTKIQPLLFRFSLEKKKGRRKEEEKRRGRREKRSATIRTRTTAAINSTLNSNLLILR